MNCKNCSAEIKPENKYCSACGAKIVHERITLKSLMSGVLVSFGWDNSFLVTFRDLIFRPQIVFEKYLNGTRKKYTNPFTFFAIGVALTVFVINFYSEELINISTKASLKPSETIMNTVQEGEDMSSEGKTNFMDKQQSFSRKIIDFQYKYFYYLSFLLLPLYALIALLVFGKPENFGEHLVINAYIQGVLFFFSLLLFLLTLLLNYDVHSTGAILLTMVYYSFAYTKYRKYTIGQTIMKLLRFFIILTIIVVMLFVSGILIGKYL